MQEVPLMAASKRFSGYRHQTELLPWSITQKTKKIQMKPIRDRGQCPEICIYIYNQQTYFAGYTKFHARFKSLNQSVQCKRKPTKSKESKWLDPQNVRKLHFVNTVILCGLFGALWICYLPKPSASKLAQLCGEGEQLQQVLQVQLRRNKPRGWLSGFCQFCFWWCFVAQNSHL